MDEMLQLVLALAVIGVAGFGAYVYWERKNSAIAAEAARRRMERKRHIEHKNDKPGSRPVPRPARFGRR
jgi:hypothetical protein